MRLHLLRSAIVALAIILLMAGCAITYSIKPELLPAQSAKAMVQQWPVSVGVYIRPSVLSYKYSRGAARVDAGSQLTSSFQWAVSQLFEGVVILDALPKTSEAQSGYVGIIEFANVIVNDDQQFMTYEIIFHSTSGNQTASWSLVGLTASGALWDIERSSTSATLQSLGTGLSYAIRDQTAHFILELPNQNQVKRWLEDANVHQTKLRPLFAHSLNHAQKVDRLMMLPDLESWRYTDNVNAMKCVGDHLKASSPPVEVVNADDLRLEFFPWLEPSTAPKSIDAFRALLAEPAVQEKMRAIGIRYLLSVEGGTITDIPGGGILCGAGMGGGGCFGFAWGSRESSFSASMIDLNEQGEPQSVASKQISGVYIPAYVLPIPLFAPTESAACERLAREIHEIITKKK